MSFKMSADNFQLLVSYVEKKAKGATMTFQEGMHGTMEIKLSNTLDEPVIITLYEENDKGTNFPKISVSRRLGDEIK